MSDLEYRKVSSIRGALMFLKAVEDVALGDRVVIRDKDGRRRNGQVIRTSPAPSAPTTSFLPRPSTRGLPSRIASRITRPSRSCRISFTSASCLRALPCAVTASA